MGGPGWVATEFVFEVSNGSSTALLRADRGLGVVMLNCADLGRWVHGLRWRRRYLASSGVDGGAPVGLHHDRDDLLEGLASACAGDPLDWMAVGEFTAPIRWVGRRSAGQNLRLLRFELGVGDDPPVP